MTRTITLKKVFSVLMVLVAFTLVQTARAQVTLNFTYDGTNTVSTFTVATNTFSSSLFYGGPTNYVAHDLDGGYYTAQYGTQDVYGNGTTPFTNTAWGSDLSATSYSGDAFSLQLGGYITVPQGYNLATGTALTGSMTWANTDLVTLGFASNSSASGSFNGMGATVNWSTTNTSAIPEPSTYAAIFGACALGLVAYRRHRLKQAA
jgi:hypothetical protein